MSQEIVNQTVCFPLNLFICPVIVQLGPSSYKQMNVEEMRNELEINSHVESEDN